MCLAAGSDRFATSAGSLLNRAGLYAVTKRTSPAFPLSEPPVYLRSLITVLTELLDSHGPCRLHESRSAPFMGPAWNMMEHIVGRLGPPEWRHHGTLKSRELNSNRHSVSVIFIINSSAVKA